LEKEDSEEIILCMIYLFLKAFDETFKHYQNLFNEDPNIASIKLIYVGLGKLY